MFDFYHLLSTKDLSILLKSCLVPLTYDLFVLQDQQISAIELQRCLTSSGIAGSYQQFCLETCRIMINMLDHDYSGQMGFNEFKELWGALHHWKVSL